MIREILGGFAYGGDYNPEQWSEETWAEDMRLMTAAGVNLVSVGIFSWAKLQPREDEFDFSFLDKVMDLLEANGIKADLATATAAHPAWLGRKFPEVMAVGEDGIRFAWGSRQAYCPNSRVYRDAAALLTEKIAGRYADHPALAMWHVNNEYACHVDACYCDTCAAEFRSWLGRRYGDLEAVNLAWGTAFWSQKYGEWDEVLPPRRTTTHKNPTQVLDYRRFMSDSILELFEAEKTLLKKATPDLPVTTNFMPFFKPMDYWRWAAVQDVISWDSYPDPLDPASPADNAFDHDLMRSLGGGAPFMLMEQAASQVNWRGVNAVKPPGMMRFHSFQALAAGADAVMFFQWRQSRRGAEQFHSGMVPVGGEDTRTFREVAELGAELRSLSDLAGSRIEAETAILWDYESWWYVEGDSAPLREAGYRGEATAWHRTLREANIAADFLSPDGDPGRYRLIIAPLRHLVREGEAERLESWVAGGGRLIVTYGGGTVDETGAIFEDGPPGPFRSLLGVKHAELDPLPGGAKIQLDFGDGRRYSAGVAREALTLDGAETLAVYSGGWLDGRSAVTRHGFGKGSARYVAVRPGPSARRRIVDASVREVGVSPVAVTPEGVTATRRRDGSGRSWLFLLRQGRPDLGQEAPESDILEVSLPEGASYRDPVTGDAVGPQIGLRSWDARVLEETPLRRRGR